MISDQVIINLSRGIDRFMRLQHMMSTGRRINKPSDDPIGTINDLGYRSKLSQLGQFQKNISHGKMWLSHVDLALADMGNLLIQAKGIAVALANDTYDGTARAAAAIEIESIFNQVLQSGNAQLDNRYLFSGHRTLQAAFRSTGVGVIYEGDNGNQRIQIEAGSKVTINIIGSDLLTKPFTVLGDEADLAVGVNANTLLAELNDGRGVDLSPGIINVTDVNLNITVAVDVSTASDLNDIINSINTQLAAGGITNITAALGLEGNNISLSATDRPDVALSTPLVNLNQGSGIDMSPPKFEIHNSDHSISAVIDISTATTIGDVINAINSQLATAGVNNVTASLNPAGTGLQIQDTNGVPLGLSVSEFEPDNGTAGDLGILGAIGPTLIGTDLDPRPEFSVAESAVGETTASDLGILGNMNYALVGNDLDPSITASTLVSLFNNGIGYGLDQIRISQGGATATVDLGLATIVTVQDMIDALNSTGLSITAAINSTSKGISITNTDPDKTLIIKDIRESKPAEAMGIAGSPDVMGNLLVLIDALRENNSEVVRAVIEGLDLSLDEILNQRGSAGAKSIRLETTDLRLTQYSFSFTRLLSETEDVDITRLIADLAQQEAVYRAALNAAAKIIQPSLLDFLR